MPIIFFLLLMQCSLPTHAASNHFPRSLITHHNIPVTIGTIVGYIVGNQLDHSPFGTSSLTGAVLGTLAGAGIDRLLSGKKHQISIISPIEQKTTQRHETSSLPNTQLEPQIQKPLSEFDAIKQVLYATKGKNFKIWFETQYAHKYPTKDAAWGLYWNIESDIIEIIDNNGHLNATCCINKQNIILTDIIWQEMFSIKNLILKNKAQTCSLQN